MHVKHIGHESRHAAWVSACECEMGGCWAILSVSCFDATDAEGGVRVDMVGEASGLCIMRRE